MNNVIAHDIKNQNLYRVYKEFYNIPFFDQYALVHKSISGLDFKIKKYSFSRPIAYKKFLLEKSPKVVTQSHVNQSWFPRYAKYKIHPVFIHHGFWGNKINDKALHVHAGAWTSFRAIFGGTTFLTKHLSKIGVSSDRVFLNCVPQLDNLYNVLQKTAEQDQKNIVVFSHTLKNMYKENSLFLLQALDILVGASKVHNFKIYLKYKNEKDLSLHFNKLGFVNEAKIYNKIVTNKNIIVVDPGSCPYKLLAESDIVICSAASSIELESMMANKKVIILDKEDYFGASEKDCSLLINKLDDFRYFFKSKNIFNYSNQLLEKQNLFISGLGLSFDGKHTERVMQGLKTLL